MENKEQIIQTRKAKRDDLEILRVKYQKLEEDRDALKLRCEDLQDKADMLNQMLEAPPPQPKPQKVRTMEIVQPSSFMKSVET